MSAAGLAGVSRRKFVHTTVEGSDRQAPDLVERNFTAERPRLSNVAGGLHRKISGSSLARHTSALGAGIAVRPPKRKHVPLNMLPAQPHHITARLHGGRKTGTPVDIAILPELQTAIDAMLQSLHLTFVVTEQGRPFTSASFGDWFWGVCQEAGIRKKSERA
jgi:hypothetical protein